MAAKAISATLDQSGDPSAALVSIQPSTGYILAMVSSSDYDTSKFNLAAQAQRQPGSTFKMFALVGAIEMGVDPYRTYYDSKPLHLQIPGSTTPRDVSTFGNRYYGPSTLFQATLRMYQADRTYPEMDFSPPSVLVQYDPRWRGSFAVVPTSSTTTTSSTSTTLLGGNTTTTTSPGSTDTAAPPSTSSSATTTTIAATTTGPSRSTTTIAP